MDDPMAIYKDLDLDATFRLDGYWHERLMYQLKADSALLEACHVGGVLPMYCSGLPCSTAAISCCSAWAVTRTSGACTSSSKSDAICMYSRVCGTRRYTQIMDYSLLLGIHYRRMVPACLLRTCRTTPCHTRMYCLTCLRYTHRSWTTRCCWASTTGAVGRAPRSPLHAQR